MPADAVWQGRIAGGLDPRAKRLNDSLPVDRRLWPEELALSRAYAVTLRECGVLSDADLAALLEAVAGLESDLAAGRATLAGEDVHSAVEAALTERCGDPARRLHTGRSRNDQVATLMRMHVMRLTEEGVEWVRELERALVAQARAAGERAVAAYTHLQAAQPVRLAHLWLAHVAALERDEERFLAAREAADRLPLGSGAVAGSPLVYDRLALAARLGFDRLAENSVDAVGDRDFALEYLNAAALLGVHLSRLAEDLVLWCSPGWGWYVPADGFSTGSSLLPQKRNPDLFELARGKSARLMTNAQRLAVLLKGLPSAYQKDLQEDKEAVFDTADTLASLLAALPDAIATLAPRPERMAATLTPELLAVELADALVALGLPFRDAHAVVGRLWAAAERAGVTPAALPLEERLAMSPHFTDARLAALTVEAALARRDHEPGGGSGSVAAQLARAEGRLGLGDGDPEGFVPVPRVSARPSDGAPAGDAPADRAGAASFGTLASASSSGSLHPVGPPPSWLRASSGAPQEAPPPLSAGTIRRATLTDVPGIARLMAGYVAEGVLLPRPVSELYQCVREFHVAIRDDEIVGCAALRVLWEDLGEVRSLAVRADQHGTGLGQQLVAAVIADARALALPRVIALTRELAFFERCGFVVGDRQRLPRKVWTDCVRCPKRHACDEIAVVLDLVPGATETAERGVRSFILPIPPPAETPATTLPIVS
ncbi:MAG: argininosuccinate lyase [Candidatus Eisenbacteria bacterium]